MSTASTSSTKVSGPKGRFLFGHLFDYLSDPLELFERSQREFGDVVKVRLVPWQNTYLLFHPEHVEQMLRHQHRLFMKDRLTHQLSTFLGNGLLTSEGDFWKRQRRLIQPGFQHSRVDRYAEIMVAYTQRMTEKWQEGEERDLEHDMMQLTLEIVAKALFNEDLSADETVIGTSLGIVMEFFRNPINWTRVRQWIPTPSLFRFRRAKADLYRVVDDVIRHRRGSQEDPGDLLSSMMKAQDEDGGQMTDQQLRDELITLMLAGHETTALTLTFALYLISGAPEVESRIVAEIQEVLGDRPATAADVPKLDYVGKVIQEVMRLYPPAWMLGREALEDVEIGGHVLKKGAQISVSQWVTQRDPRWYEEPNEFRPERWTDEMKEKLPRCAYFPFGDGPRVCVGNYFATNEAILVLATLFQRCHFQLAMSEEFALVPSITLRPKYPMMMRLTKRKF